MFINNEVNEIEKTTTEKEYIPTKNMETSIQDSPYKLDIAKESFIEEFNYSNDNLRNRKSNKKAISNREKKTIIGSFFKYVYKKIILKFLSILLKIFKGIGIGIASFFYGIFYVSKEYVAPFLLIVFKGIGKGIAYFFYGLFVAFKYIFIGIIYVFIYGGPIIISLIGIYFVFFNTQFIRYHYSGFLLFIAIIGIIIFSIFSLSLFVHSVSDVKGLDELDSNNVGSIILSIVGTVLVVISSINIDFNYRLVDEIKIIPISKFCYYDRTESKYNTTIEFLFDSTMDKDIATINGDMHFYKDNEEVYLWEDVDFNFSNGLNENNILFTMEFLTSSNKGIYSIPYDRLSIVYDVKEIILTNYKNINIKKDNTVIIKGNSYKEKKHNYFELFEDVQLNDNILFGSYEMNGEDIDGVEPLAWNVVKKEGNLVQLLAKKSIIAMPYNSVDSYCTWEDSLVRKFLNETFYNKYFTEEEKELMILTESIPTYEEKSYGARTTYEYISILSEEEANEAFSVTSVGGLWSGLKWDASTNDHEKATISYVNFNLGFWLKSHYENSYDEGQQICTYEDDNSNYWDYYYATYYTDKWGVKPTVWLDLSKLNK